MSEEEILEIILELQCNFKKILKDDGYNDYTKYITSRNDKAIQGLLDLYNEEKEKNSSLQKEIKLMKSININDNYISKNEIRERITQLELLDKQYYKELIVLLEKLIEED